MPVSLFLAVCLCLASACGLCAAERAIDAFRTGREFQRALDAPLAAVWQNSNLRTIVRGIGDTRRVAILLDRRVDPSCELSFEAVGEPLGEVLEKLAAIGGAASVVVGDVVYIGPREAVGKIAALIERRQRELTLPASEISRSRGSELRRPLDVRWNDLDSPREIVHALAERCGLAVDARDSPIPFDLWGGAVLPQTSLVEALSLVLIQFDMTFEWVDGGTVIRLVAAPPLSEFDVAKPPDRTRKTPPARQKTPEIAHQRYTLQKTTLKLRALFQKLEEPALGGYSFDYDSIALREAGIDLDQRISLDVNQVTIEQLLREALGQARLQFTLEDRVVRLSPRK